MPSRYLIMNADDFGLCDGVNAGIIHAHAHGIVTSASLMVRYPSAVAAAAIASRLPSLSLGLHLDLCEWVFDDNGWTLRYEVVPLDDADAISKEVNRQVQAFAQLTGGNPTHLDSHQHVHKREPTRTVTRALAESLGIPLREVSGRVNYVGGFYGQSSEGHPYPRGIAPERLIALIDGLPNGVSEIGCHPGFLDGLRSSYRAERVSEVAALCDPGVRRAISRAGVNLVPHGSECVNG